MPISNKSNIKTGYIDIEPNNISNINAAYSIDVNTSGLAEIDVDVNYFGTYHNLKNKFYSELIPEKKKRYYSKILSELALEAQAESNLNTDFEIYPGNVNYVAKIERYALFSGNYMYIILPDVFSNILKIPSDIRKHAYYIDDYTKCKVTFLIKLPTGYPDVRIMPSIKKLELPNGSGFFAINCIVLNNYIKLEYEIYLKPSIMTSRNYEELVSFIQEFRLKKNRMFLLKK